MNSKEAIINAAFELYNENPSANLADIAERAGVGRATLHRHFNGRDELMLVLAHRAIEEIDAVAASAVSQASSSIEALRLILVSVIPLANRQWFLACEPFDRLPEIAAAYQRQVNETVKLIAQAKKEGAINTELDDLWLARVYDNLIFAAWEMVQNEDATPKQAANYAWQSFCEGSKVKVN